MNTENLKHFSIISTFFYCSLLFTGSQVKHIFRERRPKQQTSNKLRQNLNQNQKLWQKQLNSQ